MKAFVRSQIPFYLSDYENLGKIYAIKKTNQKKGKSVNFDWYGLYEPLLTDLSILTQNHCSYCDFSGVRRGQSSPTIDHFRPKSKFPLFAYTWDNLFLCCTECQKRISKFNELLLKPDTMDYSFDEYFIINTITGEIEPNILKNKGNQERAKETIKIFRLNAFDRPKYRLEVWNSFKNYQNPILDDFSYRFFIERIDN